MFYWLLCVTVAAGDWKHRGGQKENQSTVSRYFIQVNYLTLLSYIQWKLSNKTMTNKTSLKNILLNGWYTKQKKYVNKKKNKKICTPSGTDPQSPVWQAAALPTVLPQQSMYVRHDSTEHLTHHSSLITIAQNNGVAALYCVPSCR